MAKLNKNKIKLDGLTGNKREVAESLLDKIVFMETELDKLQTAIKEKGWVEAYQNGANQFGLKKSTEGDVYNTLIKNYNTTLKQLLDIAPQESDAASIDDLLNGIDG